MPSPDIISHIKLAIERTGTPLYKLAQSTGYSEDLLLDTLSRRCSLSADVLLKICESLNAANQQPAHLEFTPAVNEPLRDRLRTIQVMDSGILSTIRAMACQASPESDVDRAWVAKVNELISAYTDYHREVTALLGSYLATE